jgi:hypothetical protein
VEYSPAAAVPVRTKIPEPMIAPIPRAVRDHGPSDFGRRWPGRSESEISLSMDFLAKSWLDRKVSLRTTTRVMVPGKGRQSVEAHRRRAYAVAKCLTLGRSADHLLHLGLLGTTRVFARLLGRLLLARCALCLLAFFLVQCLRICHVPVLVPILNQRYAAKMVTLAPGARTFPPAFLIRIVEIVP